MERRFQIKPKKTTILIFTQKNGNFVKYQKGIISYVEEAKIRLRRIEVLKNCYDAVGRTFFDAISRSGCYETRHKKMGVGNS